MYNIVHPYTGVIMSGINVQKISYCGWDNCIQVANEIVHLIITVDVGPRIIRYGFNGLENELCEIESTMGLKGGDEWRLYGGHRLWHSPEAKPRTYEPDNSPVAWEQIPNGVRTVQEEETRTRIKKEMQIVLSPENSEVKILHRLTNAGPWPVEISVWSITAMATGGKEIVPQECGDTGLLPNRILVLWPYTKMNDPRVQFGDRYIILKQDPEIHSPLKFGISNTQGWAAYFNHNHLFAKYYQHDRNALYPDFGASYETYTNDVMLEMETLSPLTMLEPGSHIEHMEKWEIFNNVPMPGSDQKEIDKILAGKIVSNQ
jgi:hypothetical protein